MATAATLFGGIVLIWLIFWLVVGVFALLTSIFWIVEIIDVLRREFRDTATKLIWLLLIVFTHFIGALIYYFIGKRQGSLPDQAPR